MLKEVGREVDYIMEGIALLQHLGRGDKYSDLKKSLNRKYASPFREGLHKFALLERIEQEAAAAFREEADEVHYYFSNDSEGEISYAGNLALLWNDFKDERIMDTAQFRERLNRLTETEYCEKFGICLQEYLADIVRDESQMIKMREPFEIISYLMKMELRDEEKWKLQKIFFDREEHQERVLSLLEKAVTVLKRFQKELNEVTELFCQYWEKQLAEQDLTAYVRDLMKIDVGGSALGFCIRPSIILPNVLMLDSDMEEDGTYKRPDICRVGILFGEDFDFRISPAGQDEQFEEYALKALKALADKSKFEILSYIRDKEAYGSELAKHLNLTTATVSHHMNALLLAGLLEIKHRDNRVYYLANKRALGEILDYCKRVLTGSDER